MSSTGSLSLVVMSFHWQEGSSCRRRPRAPTRPNGTTATFAFVISID
jgi:hypothetical protein